MSSSQLGLMMYMFCKFLQHMVPTSWLVFLGQAGAFICLFIPIQTFIGFLNCRGFGEKKKNTFDSSWNPSNGSLEGSFGARKIPGEKRPIQFRIPWQMFKPLFLHIKYTHMSHIIYIYICFLYIQCFYILTICIP